LPKALKKAKLTNFGEIMPNEIISALIGAGATLCATTIPLAVKSYSERRSKHLSARRHALLDRWEGTAEDYYVEDSQKTKMGFAAVITFDAVGPTVKAHAVLTYDDGQADQISLVGMFYNDDYLQLSYYNKNLALKQLGVVVLRLDPDGSTLSGYYTGFSPRRQTIVAGTIKLLKKE